jgi:hypothetical protein
MIPVADSIAGSPKLRSDASVGRVLVDLSQLTFMNPIGDFGAKLEVDTLIINGPTLVSTEIQSIVCVGDEIVQGPFAWLKVYVCHPDQRNTVPPIRPHGA